MESRMKRFRSRRFLVAAVSVAVTVSLSACGGTAQTPVAGRSAAATPSTDGPTGGVDLFDQEFPVTWQKAVQHARAKFEGDVTKIELERERGQYAYTVELLSNTQEYSVHLDAKTGDEVGTETEDLDADERNIERQQESIDLTDTVALRTAMDAARHARSGTITSWKIEGRASGPQYEFDVENGSEEDYEVKVDAVSGEVISVDR